MADQETLELLCPRALALWLGAVEPINMAHHRELKRAGHMLLRDIETSEPMFWPLVSTNAKTRQV